MKKRFALILSFVFLLTMALPIGVFADGLDKGLENAIKIAKVRLNIPDGYKFESSIDASSGNGVTKKVFRMTWTSKENEETINASVDDKGIILNYSHYKNLEYVQQNKLPKYSASEAKAFSDKFLSTVIPEIAGKLRYEPNNYSTGLYDTNYYITYTRVENGVPFYNDQAVLNVDRNTGEVNNYYLNWTDNLTFADPAKAITISKAQEAYTKNLGLRLTYKYNNTDGKMVIYPVYVPKYNSNYVIDALTGQKIDIGYGGYRPYYDMGMTAKEKANLAAAAGENVALSPEEIKAVENAGQIISIEKAESIARSLKYVNLNGFKLEYWNLSKSWPANDSFNWYMSFRKPASKNSPASYAGITVDAISGKVKSFSSDWKYVDGAKAKISPADAKTAVDKFLKEFKPDLYSQVVYDDAYNMDYSKQSEKPTYISLNYVRKVNGAFFPDNMITIGYDAVNGKVVSFDMNWFNVTFPSVAGVIKIDTAYKSLFDNIGLELQYCLVPADSANGKVAPVTSDTAKPKAVLAYTLKPNKPAYIDANNGGLLDYGGKPYIENTPVKYTDISGNAAENEIKTLAEYGITTGGKEFKPAEAITQKDFMILLSKTLGYNVTELTSDASDEIINNMYSYLDKAGVVKSAEKSVNAKVSREEAVKFIIRALKYDKLADYTDMFNCNFTDKSSIAPELVGYVTIAGNLKLIDYGNFDFKPKAEMTRAETAVLIYKYLKL